MDRTDIWMVQGGSSAGFAAETFQCLWVLRYIVRQELQRDKPAKRDILGLIDYTHPAAAELLDDTVVRDGLADHWRESYDWETCKSTKPVELVIAQEVCWRKLATTLIYGRGPNSL